MANFNTPGAYVIEKNSLPMSVSQVATAIPVFIGYTKVLSSETLHFTPTRITSLLEYVEKFGAAPPQDFNINLQEIESSDATPKVISREFTLHTAVDMPSHLLYYSLMMYFANGGGPCYVLSVNDYSNAVSLTDFIPAGTAPDVATVLESYDEPTLIVVPDSSKLSDGDHCTLVDKMLGHCNKMQDRFLITDVPNAIPSGNSTNALVTTNFRGNVSAAPEELKYGAVYFPFLETNLDFVTEDPNITINVHQITREDGNAPTLPNVAGTTVDDTSIKDDLPSLYHAAKNYVSSLNMTLPPSGAIAGIYCKVDNNRNVWKAPANVGVSRVVKPTIAVNNDLNGDLNVDASGKSVNVIRSFTGRGNLVWGARTLNAADLNWRFINVRRTVTMIEQSIKQILELYVFEPNTSNTWVKVQSMINSFLTSIWKDGGLAGAKAEDAFEVHIGVNKTMTPTEIAQGIMNVEIVLVPSRPAEVIKLIVSQKLQVS